MVNRREGMRLPLGIVVMVGCKKTKEAFLNAVEICS